MAMQNLVTAVLSAGSQVLGPFDVQSNPTVSLSWSTGGVATAVALTGTVSYEGSPDNINWYGLPFTNQSFSITQTNRNFTGSTNNGADFISTFGMSHMRVRVSSYTSGSVNYNLDFSNTTLPLFTIAPNTAAVSGTVSANTIPTDPTNKNYFNSAATTNATSVKAAATKIFSLTLSNNGAAAAYFKIYNKASAPTVGTDTPVAVHAIPANGTFIADYAQGFVLTTGYAFAITNLSADSDTTAIAAGQVKAVTMHI
jgi:hypothetical protein